MKSLITVTDKKEAEQILSTETDIIDIKNPEEGSLGANFPWIVEEIVETVSDTFEISLAIGDVPNLPGTVSFAVAGAAKYSPDYIKIGLLGPETVDKAVNLLKKCRRAIKDIDKDIKVVGALYADYQRCGSINPLKLPEIGEKAGADLIMVDTAVKDGKNIFDHMSLEELKKFVEKSHEKGLETALAGSLRKEHVEKVREIKGDIFGVRGAVCDENVREASISREKTEKLVEKIKKG